MIAYAHVDVQHMGFPPALSQVGLVLLSMGVLIVYMSGGSQSWRVGCFCFGFESLDVEYQNLEPVMLDVIHLMRFLNTTVRGNQECNLFLVCCI